ncbi:hypothetical protein KUF71_009740 [Frankliniella fusca]|uniref:Uncharacterized protein n=1 Tax=Frankliniella fusca TaxID=407009 RepID=A0AAE1HFQ0_9NEOP|nr:hypothetical protein KUF71_009740 [Frankliniella fusca]
MVANYLDAHLGRKNREEHPNYETEQELGVGCRKKKRRRFHDEGTEEEKLHKVKKPAQKKPAAMSSVPVAPVIVVTPTPSPQPSTSARDQEKSAAKPLTPAKNTVEQSLTGGLAPVSVVSISSKTQSIRMQESKKTINVIRRDKGTKADSIEDLKKIMKEKQQMLNQQQSKNLKVSTVSPIISADKEEEKETDSDCSSESSKNFKGRSGKEISDSDFDSEFEENFEEGTETVGENFEESIESVGDSFNDDAGAGGSSSNNSRSFSTLFHNVRESPKSVSLSPVTLDSKELSSQESPSSIDLNPKKITPPSLSQTSMPDDKFKIQVLTMLSEINKKTEACLATSTRVAYQVLPNKVSLTKSQVGPGLPLRTLDDVESMEKELAKSSNNIANLSIYLSNFVQSDRASERKSAMKVMDELMWNCCAKHFSMDGKKGKRSFSDLLLWKAVKGAVSHKIEGTDFSVARSGVMSWLKYAHQRTQEDGSDVGKQTPKKTSSTSSKAQPTHKSKKHRKDKNE